MSENNDTTPSSNDGDRDNKNEAHNASTHKPNRASERQPSTRTSGKYYTFNISARFEQLRESKADLYVLAARYGSMCHSGQFFSTMSDVQIMDSVIVKTDMGVEMADILSSPKLYDPIVNKDAYFIGEVLRAAEKEDDARWDYIQDELQPAEFKKCCEFIGEHKLPMKLVDVEHLFGNDRIVFYFLADGRVDFRALVRDLSKEFKTRIEMRQIGVRDEARLLADYEHCGRPLCCKTFVDELKPVTMKMAKQQKTTLDPAKISGRCGRLMCCLRFEDEVYSYLKKTLPRKGQMVLLKNRRRGKIHTVNLLREMVLVIDDRDNREWLKASEIKEILED